MSVEVTGHGEVWGRTPDGDSARVVRGSISVLGRAFEVLAGISVALVFFLIVLWVLHLTFPDATGIGELMRAPQKPGDWRAGYQLQFDELGRPTGTHIATLSALHGDIREKPDRSVTWSKARRGNPLENRHAVQSSRRSGATISFDRHNRLQLGESSLIIVTRPDTPAADGGRVASVVVIDGTLRGRMARGDGPGLQLQMFAGTAAVQADSDRAEPAEFAVSVDGGETATISVFEGAAEVQWGGETTVVPAQHAVSFTPTERPSAPRALPARPSLTSPADGAVFYSRHSAPRVRFEWQAADETSRFRVLVARDPGFTDTVHDKRVRAGEIVHGNLADGVYYWRVSGIADGAEGGPSEPRRFEIVRDRQPPELEVQLATAAATDGPQTGTLSGVTEPGSDVFVGSERVPVGASGDFEVPLDLRQGYNIVLVQAVDPAGNTTFRSHVIYAGPSPEGERP